MNTRLSFWPASSVRTQRMGERLQTAFLWLLSILICVMLWCPPSRVSVSTQTAVFMLVKSKRPNIFPCYRCKKRATSKILSPLFQSNGNTACNRTWERCLFFPSSTQKLFSKVVCIFKGYLCFQRLPVFSKVVCTFQRLPLLFKGCLCFFSKAKEGTDEYDSLPRSGRVAQAATESRTLQPGKHL